MRTALIQLDLTLEQKLNFQFNKLSMNFFYIFLRGSLESTVLYDSKIRMIDLE